LQARDSNHKNRRLRLMARDAWINLAPAFTYAGIALPKSAPRRGGQCR